MADRWNEGIVFRTHWHVNDPPPLATTIIGSEFCKGRLTILWGGLGTASASTSNPDDGIVARTFYYLGRPPPGTPPSGTDFEFIIIGSRVCREWITILWGERPKEAPPRIRFKAAPRLPPPFKAPPPSAAMPKVMFGAAAPGGRITTSRSPSSDSSGKQRRLT